MNGDGCDEDCSLSRCGNGIVAGDEACDDGNDMDADGCDSNCTVTACGNALSPAARSAMMATPMMAMVAMPIVAQRCGNGRITGDELRMTEISMMVTDVTALYAHGPSKWCDHTW